MKNSYSVDDLLDFLQHAGHRGLMPAATAGALVSASRNVFGILDEAERADIRVLDIEKVITRFNNKRAHDFNPTSLKEYGRRARRSIELYAQWRSDPSNFTTKTRTTTPRRTMLSDASSGYSTNVFESIEPFSATNPSGYQSSFPIRPGRIVTISNIPDDLTKAEADRLSQFIRMLVAVE